MNTVQRPWARRWSPRMLFVALTSVVMVLSALAVSQAGIGSPKPVSVAMLSGATAPLPAGADVLPGEDLADAEPALAPESPPTTAASTTTTAAESTTTTAARAGDATAAAARLAAHPCPRTSSPHRPCPPPCAQTAPSNGAATCPPPCAEPASPSGDGSTEPARPACPPPPCDRYDTANGGAGCPQPCPAYATADGQPAPCPPPCYDAQGPASGRADGSGSEVAYDCPPPCAYPTEPDGGIGSTKPAIMIYCPPCSAAPDSGGSCPPPPCEREGSCPQPCYEGEPAPTSTSTAGSTDPAPPSRTCPPPCPSAASTDRSCTPPCSYPGSSGSGAGTFAPCPAASGVAGRVTAGPTCPVERPDEPCPDRPVETTLRLLRRDGSVAATGKSAPDGTFKIAAAPGSYRLVADWPSRVGGCAPVEVTVERGRFTHADVSCDTGIR